MFSFGDGVTGARVELRPFRGLAPRAGLLPAPAARVRTRMIPPSRLGKPRVGKQMPARGLSLCVDGYQFGSQLLGGNY